MKLVMGLLAVLFTPPIGFSETKNEQNRSEPSEARVVEFPNDRSIGQLFYFDPQMPHKADDSENVIPAKGRIVVPTGKQLGLLFSDPDQRDDIPVNLSPLDQLGPNDLQALSIAFSEIPATEIERLTRHRSLRALGLGPLSKVSDDSLAPLARMTWLEALHLPETDISDNGLKHLQKLTKLKLLTLYGTRITDDGLIHLKWLTQLEHLDLGATKITDKGLEHLAGLTALENLQLWNTQIEGPGLVHLRQMSKLNTLHLGAKKITSPHLVHLQPLTELQRLDLRGTQVDDAGLAHLADLRDLKTLLLFGTKVTDDGVKNLKQILTNCQVFRE